MPRDSAPSDATVPTDSPESLPVPSPEIIREFPDRGAQWLFEDPRLVQELLAMVQPALANSLDFERAERINRTFIPADLKKKETDLLFGVPVIGTDQEIWVYLLLEHQSTVDALMALRIFLYIGEIWKAQQREWEDRDASGEQRVLWPVIPMVFYTGEEEWTQPISLLNNVAVPAGVEAFTPRWETLFISLHALSVETLAQGATVVGQALRVWRAEKRPLVELEQSIKGALQTLEGLTDIQAGQWLRVIWFFVLLAFHRRDESDYSELFAIVQENVADSRFQVKNEVVNVGKSMAQVVAERAEEKGRTEGILAGRTEGIREGRTEGMRAEAIAALESVLEARFGIMPANIRAKIEAADLDALRAWLPTAAKADTLEDALS